MACGHIAMVTCAECYRPNVEAWPKVQFKQTAQGKIQDLTADRDQLAATVAYLIARMPECDRCSGLQPTIECYCIKAGKTVAARYLAADRLAITYSAYRRGDSTTADLNAAIDEWRRLGGGE